MMHSENTRRIYVTQTLRTMGSEYCVDENGGIWIDDDQWLVILPDEDPEVVLVSFNETASSQFISDTMARFSGILQLIDLAVIPVAGFPDSNDAGIGAGVTIH